MTHLIIPNGYRRGINPNVVSCTLEIVDWNRKLNLNNFNYSVFYQEYSYISTSVNRYVYTIWYAPDTLKIKLRNTLS